MRCDLEGILVEIDTEKTRRFYAQRARLTPLTTADENYLVATEAVKNVDMELLREWGIHPDKVARVSCMDMVDSENALYDVTALVAGSPISALQKDGMYIPGKMGRMPVCVKSDPREFYNHDPPLPKPVLEITYLQVLPWLLHIPLREWFSP